VPLAINALLALVLVSDIGAIGIVIATLVAQLIQYLLSLGAVIQSVGRFVPVTRLLIVECIAGVGMARLLMSVPGSVDTLPVVVSHVSLGGSSYLALILALSSEPRTFLRGLPVVRGF
jgi:hypothetical protein